MVEPSRWAELSVGDEFAGYRIERRLGRGGMGIIYLATEPGLERSVALKLIAPEAAADDVFARRFAEESRIAASIEHPNVVPIYAAGEEDGVPWIAMRFVAGSDLQRRVAREGGLEPADAVSLIAQIGNGLDAIHTAGLVHRDVKPANVLLSGEAGSEHAYLTDFGVARNVATQSGLTQTGRFVGTLDYVAPEQISGEPIDARVDVYALGCLLFKLLTGEVPFPREGEAARLYAHLHDPPPAPSLHAPAVPMALDDVVVRAMSKSPEDRYPSAGDLGRAAQAALSGTAISIPERTVATGAAATREREVIGELSPAETAKILPQEGFLRSRELQGSRSSRGLRVVETLGALLVVVAVVAMLIAAGDSGGDGGGSTRDAKGARAAAGASADQPKPKPQTLTEAELIRQGDEICEESRDKFLRFRDPEAEVVPDVAYSRVLVGISTNAVEQFEALVPPQSLKAAYNRYVASQREVKQWDRDALAAAEAEDPTVYVEARETRTDSEADRKQMAEEIGFHVCSGSEA
ncbi:MAG TPA: serine/threonine-protein kinase [Solirubrobacterales bacterium]|jgi:serine/threonine-protein kinase|nr:serine/threonine-protein kinase [Solirubrobacterales bacterium]